RLTCPVHVAARNLVQPDPDDPRRVLQVCSDDCSWCLGLDLAAELMKQIRTARRRRRSERRRWRAQRLTAALRAPTSHVRDEETMAMRAATHCGASRERTPRGARPCRQELMCCSPRVRGRTDDLLELLR